MTDNATRWVRVCPIRRNEFATDFYLIAATRSVDVPSVLCYRRLQRHGLLVAVALSRPTAIMVRGILAVSVTFKRRWVLLLLSLMCAVETEDDCFRYTCTVSVLVSKHFFRYRYRTNAGSIGGYRVPNASIGLTLVTTPLGLKNVMDSRDSFDIRSVWGKRCGSELLAMDIICTHSGACWYWIDSLISRTR